MSTTVISGFFRSLFPFFPMSNLLDETLFLSAWSVLILILGALLFAGRLWFRTRGIKQALRDATANPTAEFLSEHQVLKREWADYERSFIVLSADTPKTTYRANTFFNESNVLSHNLNLRFWYSFPNYLVGLGILGTFVGLTFGISGIDTSDTTQMKAGINTLLSGMGLAFVTSIWGMCLSILFNIFEKNRFSSVNKDISDLCFTMDQHYQLTQAEQKQLEKQEQMEMRTWWKHQLPEALAQQFAHENEAGEQIFSGIVLREMLRESQQQTQTLKSFSTDLADGIMLSSQTVEVMGEKFAKMLEEPFQTQFTPAISKIEEAVNKLREAKEESSGKLIQDALSSFQTQMQEATSNFQDTVSNSTKEAFERLAVTIDHAGRSLAEFPQQMEKMLLNMQNQTDKVQQHLQSMAQQLLLMSQDNQDKIQSQTKETIEQLKQTVLNMQQETTGTVVHLKQAMSDMQLSTRELMTEQGQSAQNMQDKWLQVGDAWMQNHRKNSELLTEETRSMMDNIQSVTTQLQDNMKALIVKQSEETSSGQRLLEESRHVIQENQKFINGVKLTLQQFAENINNLNEISQQMLNTGDHLQASSQHLSAVGGDFKAQVRDFLESNQASLQQLEEALQAARETESMYAERFGLIQTGLSEVFGEVEKGLERYQSTTRDKLNSSLSEFSENLSTAAKHLTGAVSELAEVVEEAQDLRRSA